MYGKKPFSIAAALSQNTLVFVFNYAGDAVSEDADKTAYFAELKKHLMYDETTPIAENGINVTGSDLLISDDAGTGRTIELVAGDVTAENILYPVVFYKGTPIPFSDYDSIIVTAGEITLKSGTTTTYPSTDGADYRVYYCDPLLGIATSIEVGGVTLPIESSAFNAIGHSEPVITTRKRGEAEGTGSLTAMLNQAAILFDSATLPQNAPGEELYYRIYGSDWSKASASSKFDTINAKNFPSQPFGICVLMLTGAKFDEVATKEGQVWATANFIYHCEVTSIGPPQNISNDATDPVLQTVEFVSRYPIPGEATWLIA